MKNFAKYIAFAAIFAAMLMVAAPTVEAALTPQEQQQVASLLSTLETIGSVLNKFKIALFGAPSVAQAASAWSEFSGYAQGRIKYVNNKLYALGTDNGLYKYANNAWSRVGSGGDTVKDDFHILSENDIYAIGTDNHVYHYSSAWTELAGNGLLQKKVYFDSAAVYSIGLDNGFYKWNGTAWNLVGNGYASDFVVAGLSKIYTIGTNNHVYLWNGSAWTELAGNGLLVKDIAYTNSSGYETIYGIGADNRVYKWQQGIWSGVGNGYAKRLKVVSDSEMYAIGSDDKLWKWDGSSWNRLGDFLLKDDIAVTPSAEIYAIRMDNRVVKWAEGAAGPYTLTVTKAGTGSGTVTDNATPDPLINCGSSCFVPYTSGTSVILNATAASGSTFAGWSGEGCSGTGTCIVTMTAAKNVTATFSVTAGAGDITAVSAPAANATWTIGSTQTITWSPNVPNPGGIFLVTPSGSNVAIICGASCDTGSHLWTILGVSAGSYKVRVASSNTQYAESGTFSITTTGTGPYTLTVTKEGTGSGTVTINPGGINCASAAPCTATFVNGTVATLTATAASDSTFAGWSGDCSSTGTVTMNSNKTCTATFNLTTDSGSIPNPANNATCSDAAGFGNEQSLGGGTPSGSTPAVENFGSDDRLIIVTRGNDNGIYAREWKKQGSAASVDISWYQVKIGYMSGDPKLAVENSQLWLYVKSGDNTIYKIQYTGGSSTNGQNNWSTWSIIPGKIASTDFGVSGPTAVATSWGIYQVSRRSSDGVVVVKSCGTGSGDTTPPTISSVAATNLTSSGATITWTTANEPADTEVEYGLTTSYGTNTTLANTTTRVYTHSQALSGLTASTIYHYRVKSKDAAGNLATSGDYTFTTSSTSGIPTPATNATCSGSWTNATSLGATAKTQPSLESLSDGTLIIVAQGTDNAVYANEWKNGSSLTSGWYNVPTAATPGFMLESPALVKQGSDLWLFVKGTAGNTIYKSKYQRGTAGTTQPWTNFEAVSGATSLNGTGPTAVITSETKTFRVSSQSGSFPGTPQIEQCTAGAGTVTITSITPTAAPVGGIITIAGAGFTSTSNAVKFTASGTTTPVSNLNSAGGGTSIQLAVPNIASGIYIVSVTNSNNVTGGSWAFTVQPATTPPLAVTLTASPSTVQAGGTITVNFTITIGASNAKTTDWIGLFATSAVGGTSYVTFQYNDPLRTSGTMTFTAPSTPGTYNFRYLPRNFYVPAGISNTVLVQTTSANPPSLAFTANPTNIPTGSSAVLSWEFSDSAGTCIGARGTPGWVGSKPTSGTFSTSPQVTTGYDLTCTDTQTPSQSASLSKDIVVTPSTSTAACSKETTDLIASLINEAIAALKMNPPNTATAAAKLGQATQLLAACLTVTPPGGTTTGTIEIKRVGPGDTANVNDVPSGTKAWIDNLTSQISANPAFFPTKPTGSHIAYATDVSGYTKTAGICTFPIGGTECQVTDFSIQPSCNGTGCNVPISVTSNQVSKVVFKYVSTGGGGGGGTVNGACGPDNGGTFASLSSTDANLCSAGSVSGFTLNSTGTGWTWSCVGSGGGSTASCSATKSSEGQTGVNLSIDPDGPNGPAQTQQGTVTSKLVRNVTSPTYSNPLTALVYPYGTGPELLANLSWSAPQGTSCTLTETIPYWPNMMVKRGLFGVTSIEGQWGEQLLIDQATSFTFPNLPNTGSAYFPIPTNVHPDRYVANNLDFLAVNPAFTLNCGGQSSNTVTASFNGNEIKSANNTNDFLGELQKKGYYEITSSQINGPVKVATKAAQDNHCPPANSNLTACSRFIPTNADSPQTVYTYAYAMGDSGKAIDCMPVPTGTGAASEVIQCAYATFWSAMNATSCTLTQNGTAVALSPSLPQFNTFGELSWLYNAFPKTGSSVNFTATCTNPSSQSASAQTTISK